MRDKFYSPNAAGESILEDACNMRFGLISKARINLFNNIEARVIEISRINTLGFAELKKEFNESFNGASS